MTWPRLRGLFYFGIWLAISMLPSAWCAGENALNTFVVLKRNSSPQAELVVRFTDPTFFACENAISFLAGAHPVARNLEFRVTTHQLRMKRAISLVASTQFFTMPSTASFRDSERRAGASRALSNLTT